MRAVLAVGFARPDTEATQARAINDAGVIVGRSQGRSLLMEPVRWDGDGIKALPTLGDGGDARRRDRRDHLLQLDQGQLGSARRRHHAGHLRQHRRRRPPVYGVIEYPGFGTTAISNADYRPTWWPFSAANQLVYVFYDADQRQSDRDYTAPPSVPRTPCRVVTAPTPTPASTGVPTGTRTLTAKATDYLSAIALADRWSLGFGSHRLTDGQQAWTLELMEPVILLVVAIAALPASVARRRGKKPRTVALVFALHCFGITAVGLGSLALMFHGYVEDSGVSRATPSRLRSRCSYSAPRW